MTADAGSPVRLPYMSLPRIDDLFAVARIDDVVRIGDGASADPQQVIPGPERSEGARNLLLGLYLS